MSSILDTYARTVKKNFVKGKGSYIYTDKGEKYLDMVQGISANILGHSNDYLNRALRIQSEKIWNTSNLFVIEGQERFSQRICEHTKFDFCALQNSGLEACELMIKSIRRYFNLKNAKKNKILCIKSSFHGRSIATISAGGSPKHTDKFGPLLEGFQHFEFANHEQMKELITEETCAIMIEDTILGEAGVKKIPTHCMKGLQDLCDEKNLLLCLDAVQSGYMRSGKFFAYEYAGIKPSMVAFAKGAGGGYPVAGVLFSSEVASAMSQPGIHGSTFAGSQLSMAIANSVLDIILEESFPKKVQDISKYFFEKLNDIQLKFPKLIKEVRGLGLLIGMQLTEDPAKFMKKLLENKLITVKAGENVIRLLPPLNVTKVEIDECIQILIKTCEEMS